MQAIDLGDLNVSIGRAVAKHRAKSGLTQEQLGQELGLHDEAISRLKRGVVMPTVPRGNTNAPTIALAERATDLIRHGAAVAAQGAVPAAT